MLEVSTYMLEVWISWKRCESICWRCESTCWRCDILTWPWPWGWTWGLNLRFGVDLDRYFIGQIRRAMYTTHVKSSESKSLNFQFKMDFENENSQEIHTNDDSCDWFELKRNGYLTNNDRINPWKIDFSLMFCYSHRNLTSAGSPLSRNPRSTNPEAHCCPRTLPEQDFK